MSDRPWWLRLYGRPRSLESFAQAQHGRTPADLYADNVVIGLICFAVGQPVAVVTGIILASWFVWSLLTVVLAVAAFFFVAPRYHRRP